MERYKILLADDDPDDRELFAEAAGMHDAHVIGVPNGMQLMANLLQTDALPDVIMLDLNMPEKDGKECLREIREHDRLRAIPVVIYSTSSAKKDIDDTQQMGANLYITKPNSFAELKKAIQRLLAIDWALPIDYVYKSWKILQHKQIIL